MAKQREQSGTWRDNEPGKESGTWVKANGNMRTLKWIGTIIVIAGFILTMAGLIWNASEINSDVKKACADNDKVHPITEKNANLIVGIDKDIATLLKGQEKMDKKIDDLIMLQLYGPGSVAVPTR